MKSGKEKLKVRALALAVESVLVAMYALPAHAGEAGVAALKLPTNFVEIGVASTGKDSAKFGEYTGLNKEGPSLIGNFSLRGGDSYGSDTGTRRWSVTGTDLGLTSRFLGATVADQGRWNLGVSYDELQHNTSDSYQTPYQGSLGGSSFTLPGFGLVPDARSMTAAQLAAYRNMDIDNTRKNTALNGGLTLNRQWDIKIDFNELEQSGGKLMAFGSSTVGGAAGQRISILPMPQNYKTNTVNVAVNWKGDQAHATGSYLGSYFRNDNNRVNFQTWQTAAAMQTMGTPPGNDFHQWNVAGGYAFSSRTKLAGSLSYARNTQDSPYSYDPTMMVVPSPTASLNGLVATEHADLKLTDKTTKDLTLTAGFKYDFRDNRTASNIYSAFGIDGGAGNRYSYPNTPLSNKKTQWELAGDYRLDPKQQVRLAYNHEQVSRWCNQYASGGDLAAYSPGTNCVVAQGNKDDKISANYRRKASDDVNFNANYSFSNRRSSFDETARAAMIGTDGNITVPGAGIKGLNASDFRGFHAFFEASRKEQILKSTVNWQATEKLSFDFSGRYLKDDYNTDYGVKDGSGWSLDVDTTYSFRENGTVSAYFTRQDRRRFATNLQRSPTSAATATVPSGASYNNKLTDQDTTLGLSLKQGGLMSGKLEINSDFTVSLGQTGYDTTFNYAMLSGAPCSAPTIYTCTTTPEVTNRLIQFKLNGTYALDRNASIKLAYLYQRLTSTDYYYNGLQYPYNPNSVLPTNQLPPNYAVNLIAASYIYTFR